MSEQFYITKTINPDGVEDEVSDTEKKFLGYITIDIATTHKDRVGDILTKNFIDNTSKSLMENTSFFYNHKTMDDPIGKVVSSSVIPLSDGEYATRLKVGISKTAQKQWDLIKDGSLSKGSIGFYLDPEGYEYEEETDTLYIDKGEVIEGSLVGVPANGKASLMDVSKSLRIKALAKKSLSHEQTITQTNEGESMDETELKHFISEQLASFQKTISEDKEKASVDFEQKLKAKEDEFQKAITASEEKATTLERERDEFAKALKEGRKTGSDTSKDETADPFFLKNRDMALKKGFYEIGKLIKSASDAEITLMPSSDMDFME